MNTATPAPTAVPWNAKSRCPCCRKLTATVLGSLCHERPVDWENLMGRERATRLAKAGTCPWCGKTTTTVAKLLLGRFEPTLMAFARAGWWI